MASELSLPQFVQAHYATGMIQLLKATTDQQLRIFYDFLWLVVHNIH